MAATISGCSVEDAGRPEDSEVTRIEVPAVSESMSPNLAVGPDGTVVLSWLEADGDDWTLRFSRLTAAGWGDVALIARGDDWFVNWADFPSVVPISRDLWAAHWLVSQAEPWYAYNVFVAISADAGDSWSDPLMPHRDDTDTEHGFVTLYPIEVGVGLIWLDGRNMSNADAGEVAVSGMTLRAASLSADLLLSEEQMVDGLICDCCQTDVAITDDGPVAVYRNRTRDEIRDIYVTRHDGSRWPAGKPVADDNWNIAGCPVNGPAIEADGKTVAVAWFTAADDRSRVRMAFSEDAGRSFSAPIEVASDDTLGRVALAMLPDGDVAVSWLRKAGTESAELCLRRVSADGELGPVRVVSGDDDVPRFSFPKIVALADELIAAWTRRAADVQHVATARVPISTL